MPSRSLLVRLFSLAAVAAFAACSSEECVDDPEGGVYCELTITGPEVAMLDVLPEWVAALQDGPSAEVRETAGV